MHVGEVMTADVANGEGMRVSVFVSGCRNHCKGCFQPQTWDFNYGREYTPEIEQFIIDELSKSYYDGITILGGDPMEPENQEPVLRLLRRIKKELPDKNVWVYTGYVYDRDLVPGGKCCTADTAELLHMIDVLVDGPFVTELHDISLLFKGSSNQRVIDCAEYCRSGEIRELM